MSKINIKFIAEDTLETLKSNIEVYFKKFIDNPKDPKWINELTQEKTFIEMKYQIEDFQLTIPSSPDDRKTDIENSIILYEHLKVLPKYVLADERFWLWLMFEKTYEVALSLMIKKDSTAFKHQWLFVDGKRRGLFFGIISRCYYRVALTVDESLEDSYELSKFAIENPLRFREISWRSISNHKHVVRGMLRAEKQIYEKYGIEESSSFFTDLAKDISKLGSIKLIDAMSEEDIRNYVYERYSNKIKELEFEKKVIENNKAKNLIEEDTSLKSIEAKELSVQLKDFDDSSDLKEKSIARIEELDKKSKKGLFSFFRN